MQGRVFCSVSLALAQVTFAHALHMEQQWTLSQLGAIRLEGLDGWDRSGKKLAALG